MTSRESASAVKVAAGVTDTLHTLANEPSLGMYYVMEHIQRATPSLIGDKQGIVQSGDALHGADTDAAFALEDMALATSTSTRTTFERIAQLAHRSSVAARKLPPEARLSFQGPT